MELTNDKMKKIELDYDYNKTLFIAYIAIVIMLGIGTISLCMSQNELCIIMSVITILAFISSMYFFYKFHSIYFKIKKKLK